MSVEVLDLDILTSEGEVSKVFKGDFQDHSGEFKVTCLHQTSMNIGIGEKDALLVLQDKLLNVGWVSCRPQKRLKVHRCSHCLGYRYTRQNCTEPNRSNNCWKGSVVTVTTKLPREVHSESVVRRYHWSN